MKTHRLRLLALCSIPALAACGEEGDSGSKGVEISVAPISYPGIADVCYGLTVYNGDPANYPGSTDIVWTEAGVCSSQYGNGAGGDIAYVGPCDASVSPVHNYVELILETVDVNAAPFTLDDQDTSTDGDPDFVNPCPSTDPCYLDFECIENQDVFVRFDLTIMRDADQGFFDIAVNFEDVFCSAKFESCYDVQVSEVPLTLTYEGTTYWVYADSKGVEYLVLWDPAANNGNGGWDIYRNPPLGGPSHEDVPNPDGNPAGVPPASLTGQVPGGFLTLQYTFVQSGGSPIVLLHGPNDGDPREWTAISALACTAGPDTQATSIATELLMTTPTITCSTSAGTVTFEIHLDGAAQGNDSTTDLEGSTPPYTLEYALYYGNEDLDCGTGPGSCNKVYYNIAYNTQALWEQGLENCELRYAATAIEAGDTSTFDEYGELVDDNAQYGAISFGYPNPGLPLTTDTGPACESHPLDGLGSDVRPGYIKGSGYGGAFPGFDYHTDGGPAEAFIPEG